MNANDVDASGHPPTLGHGEHPGAVDFSPWSPVVIAMFIAAFGGTGILMSKRGFPIFYQLPVAAASGLVIGGLTFYLFLKIITGTQASSEVLSEELIGIEAEVTTPIPNHGMGEITYTAKQQRYNGPAQSTDGKEIPARTVVRIVRVVSNTFFVERIA